MQFLRRAFVGLFLVSLTLGLLAVAGNTVREAVEERNAREENRRPARERVLSVNTAALEAQNVVPIMTAFGEVRSRRTLEVRSAAAGQITELADSFEDGASVQSGDVLARIDPTDAQAALDVAMTDLAEAETDLRDAERLLGLENDELRAAEAQLDLRAAALQRQQDLQARGVGTAAAVETAALSESSARQSALNARSAVASAESRIDQAKNRIARVRIQVQNAERDLADTEIVAAFDGTLAEVSVTAGGLVSVNQQVASLIDGKALEVAFRLSTAQYARLLDETGSIISAPVTAMLDVSGIALEAQGVVTRVSANVGDGQTGRLIFARLATSAGFRPGDFVTVSIREPELQNVVVLPATAIDAGNTVLVLGEESRLEVAAVDLLRRQGDEVIVRVADALLDRRVVAERSPLLGPGIRVRDITAGPQQSAQGGRPGAPEAGSGGANGERITLTPERRAALIAAVEGNSRMPAQAKERVLAQLQEETVPARMVERIESRMGG